MSMNIMQRFLSVMTNRFVKFIVIRLFQFTFTAFPQSRSRVHLVHLVFSFSNISLIIIFFRFIMKINRKSNVIRILFNQLFNLPSARKFFRIIIQVHFNCGTTLCYIIKTILFCNITITSNFFNIIRVCSIRRPMPDFTITTSLSRENINLTSSHKSRIETNTKLTNQRRIFSSFRCKFFHKSLSSRTSNSTKIVS